MQTRTGAPPRRSRHLGSIAWAMAAGLLLMACTDRERADAGRAAPMSTAPAVPPAVATPHGAGVTAPDLQQSAPELPAAPLAAREPFPPGVLYSCVTGAGDQRQQTPIEYPPKVTELCRKAPEMGPCQYERDACRRRGGRVLAADGAEITLRTEAEYDRRVMRIRMQSN